MRGRFNATGMSLQGEEKDVYESRLEFTINEFSNPRVVVYKLMNVNNRGIEEPGFHIEGFPEDCSLRKCREINIYLDKKRWYQIFFGCEPEGFGDGFFLSRSKYDRIDVSFFPNRKDKSAQCNYCNGK